MPLEEFPPVEMRHISKSFGSVKANDDVSLLAAPGEILALLGENGSGKSTLMNLLAGIYLPDGGSIFVNGERKVFRSPHDAIAAGVGMVHQHFKLIPVMSVWENISLGEGGGPFLDSKKIKNRIVEIGERFGLAVDPGRRIYDMPVGEKQTVEIVKVLYRGVRVLVLDEPTAVLTPQETAGLFAMLKRMKEDGRAVIIITHKLQEVMEISDRVTVLRRGKNAGTVKTSETSPRELADLMVGGDVPWTDAGLEVRRAEAERSPEPMLRVRNLSLSAAGGPRLIDNISFDIHGGEIFGIAGVAGSGQKELCEIITGLAKADSGSIHFMGEEILGLSPRSIKARGIGMSFIPEDRLGMGLVGGMSITDNVLLKSYDSGRGLLVDRSGGQRRAEEIVDRYGVVTPSVRNLVKKLSGGNIQKVLLGREIETRPRLLITAYPVRGLDIGASMSVYRLLNEQKERGVGILYIGEDIDILRELCDRIMVIHAGALMATVDPRRTAKEEIGLLMLGRRPEEETASRGAR
ncbi:MAG: ABC transporter ATP-binding protein [Treponema sp.]|jgi:simple sugar transport system ATP-binding protein|nr:ABC transporter ATP-binding protein [Treponema sp.]